MGNKGENTSLLRDQGKFMSPPPSHYVHLTFTCIKISIKNLLVITWNAHEGRNLINILN